LEESDCVFAVVHGGNFAFDAVRFESPADQTDIGRVVFDERDQRGYSG
jgi:hypothetical protein